MGEEKQTIIINNKHLEKATIFVNKHNELMEEAISQEEVILFILDSWKGEEYKATLAYKGIMIFPELHESDGFFATYARVTVFADFSFDNDDFQSYEV